MKQDEKDYMIFLDGNNAGFEQLVLRYREPLIYFIYRYVNNLHLAEELAQDVFVEVLIHKERYHFKYSFKTYLFTIGRNKAVDAIRKYHKELPSSLAEADYNQEEKNELEAHIIKEEDKRVLNKALDSLKIDYKQVVYLVDFEDMSYGQAAKIMDKTVGQVKILVHRARKALKQKLEKEGYCYEE